MLAHPRTLLAVKLLLFQSICCLLKDRPVDKVHVTANGQVNTLEERIAAINNLEDTARFINMQAHCELSTITATAVNGMP